MSKLDRVMFTELSRVPHICRGQGRKLANLARISNGFRWVCDSKDPIVNAIGIGRSKLAAYRDYETQLGSV